MLVTLVTDWSLLTLSVLHEVAAVVDLVEHHGLPLAVIGAEDVVRLGVAVGAVPVVPTGKATFRGLQGRGTDRRESPFNHL